VTGLALTAMALAAHPLARSLSALLAARAVLGLGMAAIQPVLVSMVSRRAPEGSGGGVVGLASSATIFGFFVGPLAGGWLANQVGVSGVFFVAAGVTTVCTVLAAAMARRLRRDRRLVPWPDQLPR
jgi:MFS family permease